MNKERTVEVAIIGAGTAGLSACGEVRKATDNFALIEGGPYGTTCARVGCMPSKVLIQVANDFHRRHMLDREGISCGERLRVDRRRVLQYVRSLRDDFVGGVLQTIEKLGDRNIQGHARFLAPTVLDVDGQIIRAKRVIIATGSNPIVPQEWQAMADRVLTTDTLFEQEDLLSSLAVVGLGAVGVETGQALARLGINVTGITQSEEVAGLTDPVVNASLREALRREFMVHIGTVAAVSRQDAQLSLCVNDDTIHVEQLLASMGRRPNIERLGLDALGVPLDGRGLPSYDPTTLQVGDLPVFIAGDVDGDRPILHEAADDGRIAGFNSVQERPHCFKRRTRLNIVFCEPNVAVVGCSFAELRTQDIVIGEVRFEHQGRARIMGESTGMLRVYGDEQNGRLIGAELAAPSGEHLAQLLAWGIQKEMTVFEMLHLPFYHPVIEEGMRTAMRDLSRRVRRPRPGFDLALCESGAVADLE
jgi:dihydrolipoamide dehydrogenase